MMAEYKEVTPALDPDVYEHYVHCADLISCPLPVFVASVLSLPQVKERAERFSNAFLIARGADVDGDAS